MFSSTNIKPLLLLDAGQLSRVIFYHEQNLNRKLRRDWIENMEKNRQIIENMNKQYGDREGNYKMDKTNGFGHYRDFQDEVIEPEGNDEEEELNQGQNKGFFMTDVNHEEKRKKLKQERDRMLKMQFRSRGLKVVEDPEDYLQENISKRNSEA